MKLIFLRKEKSVFCSPAPPGAPPKRRPPARLKGHASEPIAAWHGSPGSGLGPMPCEQMALIAGNPETLQESRVWVFTASWSCREHQNGRPSGARPTRGGGGAAHIPEREGAHFLPKGSSAQHPAPSTQCRVPCREEQPLDSGVPPTLPLHVSLHLLQAPSLRPRSWCTGESRNHSENRSEHLLCARVKRHEAEALQALLPSYQVRSASRYRFICWVNAHPITRLGSTGQGPVPQKVLRKSSWNDLGDLGGASLTLEQRSE